MRDVELDIVYKPTELWTEYDRDFAQYVLLYKRRMKYEGKDINITKFIDRLMQELREKWE